MSFYLVTMFSDSVDVKETKQTIDYNINTAMELPLVKASGP